MVRPWKAFCAATIFVRPVSRVSLNATSLASAPGVAEEDPGRHLGAQVADEGFGQGDARFGGVEVGDVPQGVQLGGHRLDDGGMPVAEDVDRDAGEQVEIGLAVGVGDHRASPLASANGGSRSCPS